MCKEFCGVESWWLSDNPMKNNHSYNAGYHRGLNTEHHNVPIETLFKKWVEQTDILLVPVVFDPVAFEKGYNDGIEDYEDSLEEFGDEAATTAGWE